MHHREVVGAHAVCRLRLRLRRNRAAALECHRRLIEIASHDDRARRARPRGAERHRHAERRGLDAGDRRELLKHAVVRGDVLLLQAPRMNRDDRRVGNAGRVVAELHAGESRDRLHHETGCDEQRHRTRRLNHDEGALRAGASARAGRGQRALAQRLLQISAEQQSNRGEAEETRHERGECHRERDDRKVHSVFHSRDATRGRKRRDALQRVERAPREREAERESRHAKQPVLHDQILDERASAGPERAANRELSPMAQRTDEHQARDIRASDCEDCGDHRGEKQIARLRGVDVALT